MSPCVFCLTFTYSLQFRLFEIEPEAKKIFGFGINDDIKATSGMGRMAVLIHGKRIVDMIDGVLGLLGPDVEMLESFFEDLARRHVSYGVKPQYFSALGKALRLTLEDLMGNSWESGVDQAWKEVLNEIISETSKSMVEEISWKPLDGKRSHQRRMPVEANLFVSR